MLVPIPYHLVSNLIVASQCNLIHLNDGLIRRLLEGQRGRWEMMMMTKKRKREERNRVEREGMQRVLQLGVAMLLLNKVIASRWE